MIQDFDLPVTYKGEELVFPAALQASRFSHQFLLDVFGQEIVFEPDEEGSYRAMLNPEELSKNKKLNMELLKVIIEALETISK